MDPLCLLTGVSTLAVALSSRLPDEDLALAAALFTQLGDALAVIAVTRAGNEKPK
ncbi:MAG: hypothetical protein RRY95_07820 [Oscillospiraceae bacterium]